MSIAPPSTIEQHLQPWEIIAWSPEQEQALSSDWGDYFARKQRKDTALQYFNKALNIKPNNPKVLRARSQCYRGIGNPENAFDDATLAAAIRKNENGYDDSLINMEICNALYESNQFENCKVEIHDNIGKFSSSKIQSFLKRLKVLDENFNDTLSSKHSMAVARLINIWVGTQKDHDQKPECDVVSILEKEEEILSPLEVQRRKRAFEIYNQTYLNKSWIDVNFLKMLRGNSNLLMSQAPYSTRILQYLTSQRYKRVMKFTKMLHARSPLYNCNHEKFPNKELYTKQHEENLYRIQYQTRRNMFKILQSIRFLRASGHLGKLKKFIEDVMGYYVTIKTNRVMPWKFEFLCEVYNHLGLALIKPYTEDVNIKALGKQDRLLKLFHMSKDKFRDRPNTFVFGDRSSYQDTTAVDPKTIAYKKLVSRMEQRLIFARYPIERAYIMHEIALAHLNNNAFDACCFVARKGISDAKKCSSKVWYFLILMLIAKAHAVLCKVEQEQMVLKEARTVADMLKSPALCVFIEIGLRVNAEDWELKKYARSLDRTKPRKNTGTRSAITSSRSSQDIL